MTKQEIEDEAKDVLAYMDLIADRLSSRSAKITFYNKIRYELQGRPREQLGE